jgi:hypothetical protein
VVGLYCGLGWVSRIGSSKRCVEAVPHWEMVKRLGRGLEYCWNKRKNDGKSYETF